MNKKKFYQLNNRAQIIIILVLIVVLNVVSSFFYQRLDLTAEKQYSLSPTSKKIVSELDDLVTIKAFITKDLPGRLVPLRQQITDLLSEYNNYSQQKIKIIYQDPADNATIEQEASSLGIPPVQFSQVEQDKYQVANGYFGIAVLYGEKREVLPVVQDATTLEYDLTSAIKRVRSEQKAVVGVYLGNGGKEVAQGQGYDQALKYLTKQYDVLPVDLTSESIPKEIKTLVVIAGENVFNNDQLKKIDQFLMQGNSLLLMAGNVAVSPQLQAKAQSSGLEKLAERYGIKIEQNLVLDASNEMASFNTGYTQFIIPYPFFVKAINAGMNKDSVLVNKLQSITFPWISSLSIQESDTESNKTFYLVKSSSKSWLQTGEYSLHPQQITPPTATDLQPSILAAAKFGAFDSFFSQEQNVTKKTDKARLVVVGNSSFISDMFISRNPSNMVFFSNLVDGLTEDLDLISIRAKNIEERPIKELDNGWRQTIKYLNIFLPSLILAIFGFIRLYVRRREAKKDFI